MLIDELRKQMFIYEDSINEIDETTFLIGKVGLDKYLFVFGSHSNAFEGETYICDDLKGKKCPLNHQNAIKLRELFSFTKPMRVLGKLRSFGLGDRLGIATPGHARLLKKYDAYPVFAQQSIRELNLTERSYEDVLDCVTFAVFQEGYKDGFGADGDHLKKKSEIEYALGLGFTMLTLDCSEHIKNGINEMSDEEVIKMANLSNELKDKYLNKAIEIEGNKIAYSEADLARCSIIYDEAIDFANEIYYEYITKNDVDFELSIDETATPTKPTEHFYVANQLYSKGVKLQTLAPRFCGEFQKGIDYIGNLDQFEKEIKIHAAIARYFGYKLSIHSGSDKFKVFGLISKYTKGNFHVKTAGTNWLEAMKVVAIKAPTLYREIHKFALSRFNDATKFYHVTTNLNNIPNVDSLSDEQLVELFSNNDARQLIHITYGFILTDKDNGGNYIFKDKLYKLWAKEEDTYCALLDSHIGHHLELLYKEI